MGEVGTDPELIGLLRDRKRISGCCIVIRDQTIIREPEDQITYIPDGMFIHPKGLFCLSAVRYFIV